MFIIAINSSFTKHINRVFYYYCCYSASVSLLCEKYLNFSNVEWPSSLPVAFIMPRNVPQVASGLHPGIEWSSSGPYFDGSFLVVDITFCSVIWTRNVQCVEQHTRQISLAYTPYLPVNGGDSVSKRCASAMLDEGHCSGLHQSTRCV